jgi:UDP-3-O-[3-hydroxymyristoyl] N-acetylglucosamine deacetylase
MSLECQTTLAAPVCFHGCGLHSGLDCQVRILPAPADHRIRFVRTDLENAPEIPADIDVVSTEPMLRQTVLCSPEDPGVMVETVEHILASLHGMGIDNARVEMNGSEPPIGDGSARELAGLLRDAGVTRLEGQPRRTFDIARPVVFSTNGGNPVEFSAWPSEKLTLTYFMEYDHPVIGSKVVSFEIEPEGFVSQIAPARTFCLFQEVEYLRERGLIKGGSTDNAIVVGDTGILNTELLWEDELARHKLLDLLGDLFLLGLPVRGHIQAWRSGHSANAAFIQFLRKEFTQTCPT